MHGSMCSEEALAIVDSLEQAKAAKEKAVADKKLQRSKMSEVFFRCKSSCVCGKKPCEAYGYKECSACHNILKTQCNKAPCRAESRQMIKVAAAITSRPSLSRGKRQQEPDISETTTDTETDTDTDDSSALVLADKLRQ